MEELTGKRTSETDHGVSGQRTKEECMQSDFFLGNERSEPGQESQRGYMDEFEGLDDGKELV